LDIIYTSQIIKFSLNKARNLSLQNWVINHSFYLFSHEIQLLKLYEAKFSAEFLNCTEVSEVDIKIKPLLHFIKGIGLKWKLGWQASHRLQNFCLS